MCNVRILLSCLMVVLTFATSGCLDLTKNSTNTAEPPKAEPPKPMTRDEIYGELKTIISPYRRAILGQSGLNDAIQQSIVTELRDVQLKHAHNPEGAAALRDIADDLVKYAQEAKEIERWKLVKGCVDAHALLNMESHLLNRLDARAEEIIASPAVKVRGYMEDLTSKDFFVFLEIRDRKTGEIDTISVQEGDEFDQLRLVEVHANKNEVVLQYLPMENMFFTVEGVSKLGSRPGTI